MNLVEWFALDEGITSEESKRILKSFFDASMIDDGVHFGDCTSEPQPCTLCVLETILSEYYDYVKANKTAKTA